MSLKKIVLSPALFARCPAAPEDAWRIGQTMPTADLMETPFDQLSYLSRIFSSLVALDAGEITTPLADVYDRDIHVDMFDGTLVVTPMDVFMEVAKTNQHPAFVCYSMEGALLHVADWLGRGVQGSTVCAERVFHALQAFNPEGRKKYQAPSQRL